MFELSAGSIGLTLVFQLFGEVSLVFLLEFLVVLEL